MVASSATRGRPRWCACPGGKRAGFGVSERRLGAGKVQSLSVGTVPPVESKMPGCRYRQTRSRRGSTSGMTRSPMAHGPPHEDLCPTLASARSLPMERGDRTGCLVDPGRDHTRRRTGPQDPGRTPGGDGDCRHQGRHQGRCQGCSGCSRRSRQHPARDEERGDGSRAVWHGSRCAGQCAASQARATTSG